MKKIALLFLAFLFCSCGETKNATMQSTSTTINGRTIEIYVIDSCEYIGTVYLQNADFLSHKGNCKYCLKRKK